MKKICAGLLAAALLAGLGLSAFAYDSEELFASLDREYYSRFAGQDISINVYNWGEYISNGEDDSLDVNKAFEELTGIKVNYSNYGTNEELYAKLKGGGASYDVIIPSDYMIARMAQEGMLKELDLQSIPNAKHLNPSVMGMEFDVDNRYSLPYAWGTVVLLYNSTKVSPDTDVETWGLLWNEKYKGDILMFNNPRDAYGIALKKLGLPINPSSMEEITKATEELKNQRPLVQAYVMDEIFDKMGAGEAAIAPYYAGDAITMMAENPDLRAAFPREGTNIFIDSLCIPASAKQVEAAQLYINFMLEPEVGAANIEYIGYSTPNLESMELLSDEMRESEIAYPSDEVIAKAEYFNLLSDDLNRALDDGWKELLTDDKNFSFWLVPFLLALIVAASVTMVLKKNKKKGKHYD